MLIIRRFVDKHTTIRNIQKNFKKYGYDFNITWKSSNSYDVLYGNEKIISFSLNRLFSKYIVRLPDDGVGLFGSPLILFNDGKFDIAIDWVIACLIIDSVDTSDVDKEEHIKHRIKLLNGQAENKIKGEYRYQKVFETRKADRTYNKITIGITKETCFYNRDKEYHFSYNFNNRGETIRHHLNEEQLKKFNDLRNGRKVKFNALTFDINPSWGGMLNEQINDLDEAMDDMCKMILYVSTFKTIEKSAMPQELEVTIEKPIKKDDFIIDSLDSVINSKLVDTEIIEQAIEMKKQHLKNREENNHKVMKERANEDAISILKAVEMYDGLRKS